MIRVYLHGKPGVANSITEKLANALLFARQLPLELHALMVLCTTMGLLASPTVDSIRDLYQAYYIATGDHWPLQGPQLAGSIHLGPAWFYLLALPALIGENLHAVSVFVFALSGLKFYLAWCLGKQLYSSALGLTFALMLALPSWSSTQLLIWTHTSVLETAVLAYLILLRGAILHARNKSWTGLGVAYSLAIHAHPTAAPFGWLMIFATSTVRRHPKFILWWLLGFTIPLIPYAVFQSLHGFPDLSGLNRYAETDLAPVGVSEIIKLIYSVVVVGPNLFYQTTLPDSISHVFIALHWIIVVAGLAGFLFWAGRIAPRLKLLISVALANFALVTLFVILIRSRTPWHLAYASSLSLDFIYAIFWVVVLENIPKARLLLAPLVVFAYMSVIGGAAARLENGSLRIQERVFYDVKYIRSEWGRPGLSIPARHAGTTGEFLCSEPVALHGPYAASIDAHVGIEAAFTCGRRDQIILGGKDPAYTHWVGISARTAKALGTKPQLEVGNVRLYKPLAIGDSGQPIDLAEGSRNPPRMLFRAESREQEIVALESSEPSALLLSKPVGYFLDVEIHEVLCAGAPAELLVDTNYAWLYACGIDTGEDSRIWLARYTASAPGILDSVLIPYRR